MKTLLVAMDEGGNKWDVGIEEQLDCSMFVTCQG